MPIQQVHQGLGFTVHGRHIEAGELTQTLAKGADQPGILRADAGHVLFQLIGIGVNGQGVLTIGDALVLAVVVHRAVLNGAQVLPQIIKRLPRARAKQVVDAAIKDVSMPVPGSAQTAGQIVQFKDAGFKAVQPGYPSIVRRIILWDNSNDVH